MSDTLDPNDRPEGKGFWAGDLFGETTSPYVKDALNKIPAGMDADEAAAQNSPIILPAGMSSNPSDPDAPSDVEDDMDKALKEMLGEGQNDKDEEEEAREEEDDFEEVECSHCSGSGKVKVTKNGDQVLDEPLDYNQPEAPTHDQKKKMAQWKYDQEQAEVQAELDRIRKEYGA